MTTIVLLEPQAHGLILVNPIDLSSRRVHPTVAFTHAFSPRLRTITFRFLSLLACVALVHHSHQISCFETIHRFNFSDKVRDILFVAMDALRDIQAALRGRAWVRVDKIFKSLPTKLPTSRNLQDVEMYLNTTRAIVDHLNECVDPTISLKSVNSVVYGLVLHESASLPEYLAALLEQGGDLTFIIDRIAILLTLLCFSLNACDVRARLGESGTVQALSRYYCQNPRTVSVIKALTVLACGHIENADLEITYGVVNAALKVLSSTDLAASTASLFECLLRLIATIAICAPNDPSSEKETLVSIVLNVLREAVRLSFLAVAEHALTVLANASDCVLREGDGYDFSNIRQVTEETINTWISFKSSSHISHRAAWTLVSLIHIDDTAREYVAGNSDRLFPLFNADFLTYDTHNFLRDVICLRKSGGLSQKRANGRLRKPWSSTEAHDSTKRTAAVSDSLQNPCLQSGTGVAGSEPEPVSEPIVANSWRSVRTRRRATLAQTDFTTNDSEPVEPDSVPLQSGNKGDFSKLNNSPGLSASKAQPSSQDTPQKTSNETRFGGTRRSERPRGTSNSHTSWKELCDVVEKDQSVKIEKRICPDQGRQLVSAMGDQRATKSCRRSRLSARKKGGHGVSTRSSLINKRRKGKESVVLLENIDNGVSIAEEADFSEVREGSDEFAEGNESDNSSDWDQGLNTPEEDFDSGVSSGLPCDDDTRDTMNLVETDEESCDDSVCTGRADRKPSGRSPPSHLLQHMISPTEVPLNMTAGQLRSHCKRRLSYSNAGEQERRMSSRPRCESRWQEEELRKTRSGAGRVERASAVVPTASSRFSPSGKFARVKRSASSVRLSSEVIIIEDN